MDPRGTTAKSLRAAVVLAAPAAYLFFVFQFQTGAWLTAGLGDWIDPYFINYLLEHWHHSLATVTDPASPPMYYPVAGALGYSHGLILYAPFYLFTRLFLHPFPAYTLALFLAMETGAVCLYLFLRKHFDLGFVEALLVSAFFVTSANVVNSATGTWSQTASVFLIPPILLLVVVSARMAVGRARLVVAGLAGLLATLMYTQDFYTAHFAMLFAVLWLAPEFAVLASTFLLAGAALFGQAPTRAGVAKIWTTERSWVLAIAVGAFCGALVFFWCYLGAFREHPGFPESQLMNAIIRLHPSDWHGIDGMLREMKAFRSPRSFQLAGVVGLLAWVPWFRVPRRARLYALWFMVLSLVVFIIPVRTSHFSIWRQLFAHVPGFSVVRDPRKVIFVYELAAVLLVGAVLAALPRKALFRIGVSVLMFGLLVTNWQPEGLSYERPINAYNRWVTAPIAIDPTCRSFFIDGASDEYMSRSGHMWSLYGVDASFIALRYSIPTLNGYSAWGPDGWGLANPQGEGYQGQVDLWIARHELHGVCALDIDKRVMTPYAKHP